MIPEPLVILLTVVLIHNNQEPTSYRQKLDSPDECAAEVLRILKHEVPESINATTIAVECKKDLRGFHATLQHYD